MHSARCLLSRARPPPRSLGSSPRCMLLEGDSAQVKTHLQIREACGGLRAAAGGGGSGCSHAGFFSPFFIITAYRSRVPPLTRACMRASQADVTLTCTRRSSARRALLTLSLPPPVCVPPDRDGVNARSRDQAERDQTSQDPRSQWNAERGRVFF